MGSKKKNKKELLWLIVVSFALVASALLFNFNALSPSSKFLLPSKKEEDVTARKKKQEWGCDNLPMDLRPILEPHCKQRRFNDLPLSQLLPDLDFFRRIVKAVSLYNGTSIVLGAGRGTTATRTLSKWIGSMNKQGSIHYYEVNCEKNSSRIISECYKKYLHRAIYEIFDVVQQNISTSESYNNLTNALIDYLETPVLQCGNGCASENLVLLDTPIVNIFTELYMALGPTTKVLLTRRDSQEWTTKRINQHGNTTFFCDNDSGWESSSTPAMADPFSYTQCYASTAGSTNTILGNVHDYDKVRNAYERYNAYVHSLVPQDYLLDLNLFTATKIISTSNNNGTTNGTTTTSANAENNKRKWSDTYRDLIKQFLKM